jgi:hypothetical protein
MHMMEYNLQYYQKDPNSFLPTEQIIQIGGPPGYGKTTAGELGWVALQQALGSTNNAHWKPTECDNECWDKLCNRVMASFTPQRMLLFKLDFRESG